MAPCASPDGIPAIGRCLCHQIATRVIRKRTRFYSVCLLVFVLLCLLVRLLWHEGHLPSCLDGRFEAAEDSSRREIISWSRDKIQTLSGLGSKESRDSILTHLKPCTGESGQVCYNTSCPSPLPWDVEERIEHELFDVDLMLTMRHIVRIQCWSDHFPVADVYVVTAASKEHFHALKEWLAHTKSITLPELKDQGFKFSVAIVDLGMTARQLQTIHRQCHGKDDCHVTTFPFWAFPDHVMLDSLCPSWRPIVIRAFLPRCNHSLIFMEPEVRVKVAGVKAMLQKVNVTDILLGPPSSVAFPVNTLAQTFHFFHADPCAFYAFPEVPASFGIFRNSSFVNRVLVEPWASCALFQSCACPEFNRTCCPSSPASTVGQCHKFDTSVLNILLAKIFRYQTDHVTLPANQNYVWIPPLADDKVMWGLSHDQYLNITKPANTTTPDPNS